MKTHLITTCSSSKTLSAEIAFPYEAQNLEVAYAQWTELVNHHQSRDNKGLRTINLYKGQHWSRACTAAQSEDVELWVISAGLGLRHSSDITLPYESTFHHMHFHPGKVWQCLTAAPPLKGCCRSIAQLMNENRNDQFVIAGSPIYISAVECDVLQGLQYGCRNLTVITSKGYKGLLHNYVKYSHSGMMKMLKSNMTCLNISCAVEIINSQN